MPVADYDIYCKMLDTAQSKQFAFPAINVTSLTMANAVLKGLAETRSDGIIQVSTAGSAFVSGTAVNDMVLGAISIAEHVHRVAERYDIYVALHTDHCRKNTLESFVFPLLRETERRRKDGGPNLFNSHMFDGSDLPLEENLDIAEALYEQCRRNEIILEIETGVVAGVEGDINAEGLPIDKLYSTPEDMLEVVRRLGKIRGGRFMLAATFGNVHGVYKPGHVKLKPSILRDGQEAIRAEFGDTARLDLVFHGGSGSSLAEIHETLKYGVVKINVNTDTQYAFTRAVADHIFRNYDRVLKVDSEVGSKKHYDPLAYLRLADTAMAERVKKAAVDFKSAGNTLFSGEA